MNVPRSQAKYNREANRLYEEYYSEMSLSQPCAPPHQFNMDHIEVKRPKQKGLANVFRKFAIKANETIQRTFTRDSSRIFGRMSVSSLQDMNYHNSTHNHRRVSSVRPLPTVPMSPVPRRANHTRRPTGPRAMNNLQAIPIEEMASNSLELEESKPVESPLDLMSASKESVVIALEQICQLFRMNSKENIELIEKEIVSKVEDLKKNVLQFEDAVFGGLNLAKSVDQDDDVTAVHENQTSRSSSHDSIEHLKQLTLKLVNEVSRSRSSRRK